MVSHSRPRRAFWGDVRFLVGIALVAVSITAVWLIVTGADDAEPVLRAGHTIVQGDALSSDDFQVVDVDLGPSTDDYAGADDLQPGQIAARTLMKGELVPHAALTDAESSRTTTIVIASSTGLPDEVRAGTVVDVWSAPPIDDGRSYDVPRVLVAGVVVRDVREPEGVLADTGTSLELVIERSDAADVLAAVNGGSALSVLPVGAARDAGRRGDPRAACEPVGGRAGARGHHRGGDARTCRSPPRTPLRCRGTHRLPRAHPAHSRTRLEVRPRGRAHPRPRRYGQSPPRSAGAVSRALVRGHGLGDRRCAASGCARSPRAAPSASASRRRRVGTPGRSWSLHRGDRSRPRTRAHRSQRGSDRCRYGGPVARPAPRPQR
ncbi:SAF domain-containing protein [Microbacterium sp. Se63.02b]|uniref:SAF domain-containing protein n=1 Tax=Microbacterium sp. Se63.02b TaxID=2709304 RepID=UPI001FCE9F8A|nr:SAF domain-containing protein [Microbacterium sp. Se63.02b]